MLEELAAMPILELPDDAMWRSRGLGHE